MAIKATLNNGITVVMEPISSVRSIALGIWVENGSRHEKKEENGISHFIEHMMFEGTTSRSARQIADEIDAIGGQINAYTSREYTCYHTRTLDTHFDTALDILSDLVLRSKFEETAIEKERKVILEEISMYEDSPEELVHDILSEQLFNGHALGRSILGTEQTLKTFNENSIKTYVQQHYHPKNMVISVAGHFDEKEILDKIKTTFEHFSKDSSLPAQPDSPTYHPCTAKKEKDIEQIHICMSYPGVCSGSPDVYALTLLDTIFGGGISSRLFQSIREERGLAYATYSFPANYKDTGIYKIYASTGIENAKEVVRLILSEIQGLESDPISQELLSRTKEQIKSNYIISLESTGNRMMAIGRSQLLLNRIQTPDALIEKIDKVSLDGIQRLIGQIFLRDQMSLSMVGKVHNLDLEEIRKNA